MAETFTSPREWDIPHLRRAAEAAGVGMWSWNTETDEIALDDRACALWGVPAGCRITFEDLSAHIHPEDLDRVRKDITATRDTPGPYEIDFRVGHTGEIRWVSARGRGNDEGILGTVMFGVFLDVTDRKQAEQNLQALAHEMSHRVKNLFAIATGLTRISERATATSAEMAADLTQRLMALGRAHELIRPSPTEECKAVQLRDLLAQLLGAYDERGVIGGRIRVTSPEILVGEASVTTLSLIIHELATNALKYGALSRGSGQLDIGCTRQQGEVVLVWRETGGPLAELPKGPPGFGSRLVRSTVAEQLGGSIEFAWPSEGVVVTLRLDEAALGV